jgi:GNAT superfamily N-acetyltransferase
LTDGTPFAGLPVEIAPVSPFAPDAVWCLARYFDELDIRFEDGFDRARGVQEGGEAYLPPEGVFLVAAGPSGPVGCGGVTYRAPDYAEIKRMWVDPALRGQGIGRRILLALEEQAHDAGHVRVRLDSNRALPEAHAIYQRAGYREIGRYNDNPYAHIWFEKDLG